jgi:hypothetical protein
MSIFSQMEVKCKSDALKLKSLSTKVSDINMFFDSLIKYVQKIICLCIHGPRNDIGYEELFLDLLKSD